MINREINSLIEEYVHIDELLPEENGDKRYMVRINKEDSDGCSLNLALPAVTTTITCLEIASEEADILRTQLMLFAEDVLIKVLASMDLTHEEFIQRDWDDS